MFGSECEDASKGSSPMLERTAVELAWYAVLSRFCMSTNLLKLIDATSPGLLRINAVACLIQNYEFLLSEDRHHSVANLPSY